MNIINEKVSLISECNSENLRIERSRLCCDVEESTMEGSAFIRTQLRSAGFIENDMRGIGLQQCDLRGAGIERCDLTGAALVSCKLDGMTIDGTDVQEMIDFYKKIIRRILQ